MLAKEGTASPPTLPVIVVGPLLANLADARVGHISRGERSDNLGMRVSLLPRMGLLSLAALAITACGGPASSSGSTPRGSLTLTGPVNEHVAQRTADAQAWCQTSTFTPPPPALSPLMTTLEGVVHFGSGSGAISLHFVGGPGQWTLPLPGETSSPGPPGSVVVTINSVEWSGGQGSPASTGSLILSGGSGRSIRGSLNATLAPNSTDPAGLKVVGTWIC